MGDITAAQGTLLSIVGTNISGRVTSLSVNVNRRMIKNTAINQVGAGAFPMPTGGNIPDVLAPQWGGESVVASVISKFDLDIDTLMPPLDVIGASEMLGNEIESRAVQIQFPDAGLYQTVGGYATNIRITSAINDLLRFSLKWVGTRLLTVSIAP